MYLWRCRVALCCLFLLVPLSATYASPERVSLDYPISSPHYPVVLTGAQLQPLLGERTAQLAMYRFKDGSMEPVPFQIDRRDGRGRYQIPASARDSARAMLSVLDENDEFVFMASDLGERLASMPSGVGVTPIVEVRLQDPVTSSQAWVYGFRAPVPGYGRATADYVRYNTADDSIEASTYAMGFSDTTAFLVDRLQWRDPQGQAFGANIMDSMRLVHTGKFLHRFRFERTEKDYKSRVVAVKDGPVRVIRRTANRVRIMLGIGSPKVYVDHLIYPAGFVMDTIVDFPFRISLFFSDVTTLAMLSLATDESLQPVSVSSSAHTTAVPIDGTMGREDNAFNNTNARDVLLSGGFGKLIAAVRMEPGSPIETQAWLIDDRHLYDKKGQPVFPGGAAGFRMTNWEALDSQQHHVLFHAYLLNRISIAGGLALIENIPSALQ